MNLVTVTICDSQESINLEDITIGNIVNIESNKSIFSKGQYAEMAMSGLITTNLAMDIIDVYSCYSVLVKDFNKKIKGVDSFLQLKPADVKSTISSFKKDFLPKYLEILSNLKNTEEDAE